MIKTLNILFYIRKDRKDVHNKVPIYYRITYNGKRANFSVKRSIPIDRREALKGKVKGSNEESKAINVYLNLIKNKVYDIYYRLSENNTSITADIIKNLVSDKPSTSNNNKSIFTLFEEHNKKRETLINVEYALGTLERFKTCLKHLKQFVKTKYNAEEYPICRINNEFISEFDYFLRSVRKCGNNSSVKYMRNFRKIISIALANELIDKDPFYHYKVKSGF